MTQFERHSETVLSRTREPSSATSAQRFVVAGSDSVDRHPGYRDGRDWAFV